MKLIALQTAKRVVAAAVDTFGQLDGVVVNHGALTPITRLANTNIEDWKKHYDINVFSALALVRSSHLHQHSHLAEPNASHSLRKPSPRYASPRVALPGSPPEPRRHATPRGAPTGAPRPPPTPSRAISLWRSLTSRACPSPRAASTRICSA